ncbi:DUF4097 family beta strand repeat-containing protein [Cohnella caldifontis]|uniref:DUF4097 family beta strand repeat-containing protein n=1 Tax=Cohnella caldifontis TaxID=3027471 RepID=UPI0023EB5EA7|nr:DUF4097 family beta strand repeat-containing protein [Cohnella sp. YIM B05605]
MRLSMKTLAGAVLVLLGVSILISRSWGATASPEATYAKTWVFNDQALRDLNIYSDHKVKVTYVTGSGEENSVSVQGKGSSRLANAVKQTDMSGSGKLRLDLREPRRGFFWWIGNTFERGEAEIVVKMADEDRLERFGLHGDSGSVAVSGVRAESVEIAADSGGVDIQEITSGKLDVKADSGSVQLRNLTADKLSVKADSGSIKGSGIHADTAVSADSGSIRLENVTGPIRIHADSGSVKLYREDTADTDIEADSGSIYASLPSSFAGYFDLRSDSGRISAPSVTPETKDRVKAHTDSGSITIELKP